jgi:mRNA interferase RelE/StbE
MFQVVVEEEVKEIVLKLRKKDKVKYEYFNKKVRQLADNPYHGKPLQNVLKGKWRVHLGEYVLIYAIDEEQKKITFIKMDYHDKVY